MEQYVLSLVGDSSTSYKMFKGTTPLTDAELTSLFSTAGSAYFTFAFGGWTPSSTSTIQITNSSDLVVMENTGLADAVTEGKNYKGTWSANAITFDSFTELSGKALDESQLSFLMNKIKANAAELDNAAYVGTTLSTPTDVAYVATANIQDNAVTTTKIADGAATHGKVALGSIYGDANSATSVVTGNLAMKTVGTGNLRDGAVNYEKLYHTATTTGFTPATGFILDYCIFTRVANTITLEAKLIAQTQMSALAGGVVISGLPSSLSRTRAIFVASPNSTLILSGWTDSTGAVHLRSSGALSANTEVLISSTWIL